MPSPFPGMDPYLEGTLWTTVHFSLSAEIVRQLAPKLRPRYLVLPAERFVIETPESVAITAADMYPAAGVAKTRSTAGATQGTVVAPAPPELATIIPTPLPHVTVEIRDMANRQLVTANCLLLFNHASASSVTAGIAGASPPMRRMVKAKQAATKPKQPPIRKAYW